MFDESSDCVRRPNPVEKKILFNVWKAHRKKPELAEIASGRFLKGEGQDYYYEGWGFWPQ